MGEFEIEFDKTARWAQKAVEYSSELARQKSRVESISRQLALKGGYQGVKQALSQTAGKLNTQQIQMKQYGGMLGNIVKTYQNAEKAVVTSITPSMKVENAVDEAADLLSGLISKFGIAGSSASAIWKFIDGSEDGIDAKDTLKLLKWLNGTAGKTAGELAKEASERNWTSALLGLGSKTAWDKAKITSADSIGTKWKKYFDEQIGDYFPKDVKKAGSKVKAAAKYAGAALSFAVTALDNKKEQGGVMNGRAWAETITETAVDGLEGFALGGLATIALGPGAPVVAAAAVSAAAAWGIDLAYKAVSGNQDTFVEFVSDNICDAAEAAAGWAKSTWKTMADFFSGRNKQPSYAAGG